MLSFPSFGRMAGCRMVLDAIDQEICVEFQWLATQGKSHRPSRSASPSTRDWLPLCNSVRFALCKVSPLVALQRQDLCESLIERRRPRRCGPSRWSTSSMAAWSGGLRAHEGGRAAARWPLRRPVRAAASWWGWTRLTRMTPYGTEHSHFKRGYSCWHSVFEQKAQILHDQLQRLLKRNLIKLGARQAWWATWSVLLPRNTPRVKCKRNCRWMKVVAESCTIRSNAGGSWQAHYEKDAPGRSNVGKLTDCEAAESNVQQNRS